MARTGIQPAEAETLPGAPTGSIGTSAPSGGQKRTDVFAALRSRNFKLFFFGQLVSVAGTWMQTVAQQWVVYDMTHSAKWLGIVSGAGAVPYVLFSLWGGSVADRVPRRLTLVWTQAVSMVLAFILWALATNRWIPLQPIHIVILAALSGAVNAFVMPAQQAFVADLVDGPEAMHNAIALSSLRFNIARFVGPIAAGWVLVHAGAAACFLINGLSFVAVIISLLMMRMGASRATEHASSAWAGFRYIATNHRALRVVGLVGAASIFAWSAGTLFPVFAGNLHSGAAGFSRIVSANGLGAAAGAVSLIAVGDRISRRSLVYAGNIVFCFALFALSYAATMAMAMLSVAVAGYAMIVFATSSNTTVQAEVPEYLRGRVMGVYTLVFGGLLPVGSYQIGWLAHSIGAPAAVRWNAGACLIVGVAMLAWSLIDRSQPAGASAR